MSNLNCPFCKQELHKDSDGYYTCYTDNCECMKYGGNGASGSESLWLALIRTSRALEIAVDALNKIDKQLMTGIEMTCQARNALEQITALEQKD